MQAPSNVKKHVYKVHSSSNQVRRNTCTLPSHKPKYSSSTYYPFQQVFSIHIVKNQTPRNIFKKLNYLLNILTYWFDTHFWR